MPVVESELRELAAGVLLAGFEGARAPDWVLAALDRGLGGVVLFARNVVDDQQVAELSTRLRDRRERVVVGIDEEGGDVTRLDAGTGSLFPGPLALGAVADPELTGSVAEGLGGRLAGCGVTLNLAPCADLTLTRDDPIIGVRSFGSDPAAAAAQVAAFVSGSQRYGVAACAKHFPGHGASTTDSHFALPVLRRTDSELRAAELIPFAAAVRAGVRAVMPGHLVVPEWGAEPATLNPKAITGVLRGELGFTGTVVTDALEMGAVAGELGRVDGLAAAAVRALVAGADALCIGGEIAAEAAVTQVTDAIVRAVRAGELTEDRLAEAAARVAELGTVPAPPVGGAIDPDIGRSAARGAIRVRGRAGLAGPPLVVDVQVAPSMAAGAVPWGLGPRLAELLPGTRTVCAASGELDAGELAARVQGGGVVVTTRDAHRYPEATRLVTELVALGLDVVHVETGVPGPDLGAGCRVDTHGGSLVSLHAAAELLAGRS
ncbi:glycoside hydrolase family 3 N-terminal domain-containing protein [Amycolatopsis cihanbeyliensis]|uniref:Beta-N-acetylhexosaminidase n=1 Tax=Amycolatopsis cihanbeyliensis TaxID=1128664 RepID=A0A542DCW6_AMYCI|nr:glycoside hydrolase family 3 N-terminal domain-containing protein [Amycolatopsis cihanbeyliensis]TQJ00920.1 beta-N-acetylhexosaminidase [Amycolatopsis cihanbeyliensis]